MKHEEVHPLVKAERHISPIITAICNIPLGPIIDAEQDLVDYLEWASERDLPKVNKGLINYFMPSLINDTSSMKSRTSSIYCNFLFGEVREGIRHGDCDGCPNQGIEDSFGCQKADARNNIRPEKKFKFPKTSLQGARKDAIANASIKLREYNLKYELPDNEHYLRVVGCDALSITTGIRVPVDKDGKYAYFRSTAGGWAIDECYGRIEKEHVDMLKELMGDKISFEPKHFILKD